MLGILGLLGALLAGVVADMSLQKSAASDGADDGDAADDRTPGEFFSEPGVSIDGETAPGTSVADFALPQAHSPVGTDRPEDDLPIEAASAGAETEFDSSDAPLPPIVDLSIIGTEWADILTGDRGDDSLMGGAGGDHVGGGAGDDLLQGQEGDDYLFGGSGHDAIFGGDGHDVAHGEDGDDAIFGGAGDDLLGGHEGEDSLYGGAGDDTLLGGGGQDVLDGGEGDDWLSGSDGDDILRGGPGQNTLDGGAGNDTIWGFDTVETQGGTNYLNGGDGDDVLIIGASDHAHGGSGADVFMLGDWIDDGRFATIADFDADADEIVVVYDAIAHPTPTITVEAAEGATDVMVMLDGVPLALVANGAGMDAGMIRLVASGPVAA